MAFVIGAIVIESKGLSDERSDSERTNLSGEEVEERRADGSLVDSDRASENDAAELLAVKIESLYVQKRLMKPLLGTLDAEL